MRQAVFLIRLAAEGSGTHSQLLHISRKNASTRYLTFPPLALTSFNKAQINNWLALINEALGI